MEPEQRDTEIQDNKRERFWIYGVIGAVFGGVLVWGLIAFDHERDDQESQEKADELAQRFREEGFDPPDEDITISLLGTDGGRVCDMTEDDLNEAALKLNLYTNGASGPGMRPGPVDARLLEGALIVAEVYCPEQLEEFEELADDFDFEDVIRQ